MKTEGCNNLSNFRDPRHYKRDVYVAYLKTKIRKNKQVVQKYSLWIKLPKKDCQHESLYLVIVVI